MAVADQICWVHRRRSRLSRPRAHMGYGSYVRRCRRTAGYRWQDHGASPRRRHPRSGPCRQSRPTDRAPNSPLVCFTAVGSVLRRMTVNERSPSSSTNFDTYKFECGSARWPKVESIIIPSGRFSGAASANRPSGIAAPAVLNAYFAATGKRNHRSVAVLGSNVNIPP